MGFPHQQHLAGYIGSLDRVGARDHDQPYRLRWRARASVPCQFNTRQHSVCWSAAAASSNSRSASKADGQNREMRRPVPGAAIEPRIDTPAHVDAFDQGHGHRIRVVAAIDG